MSKALSETRKLVSLRILNDVFNEGATEVIDETCSKDIVVHNPQLPGDLKGIDAFKKIPQRLPPGIRRHPFAHSQTAR